MTSKLKLLVATGLASAALMNASSAYAAGTLQGTDITNQASVAYTVGGVTQSPATSNTDTFKVDRKVLFTVSEAATIGTTPLANGQTNAVTRFTVSNTSNDTLDFNLAAINSSAVRGTDAFDVTNIRYFVDTGIIGVYEPGIDVATSIDNLAPDTSVNILVVADYQGPTPTNGQYAGVRLTATALTSAGGALVNGAANTAGGVETVFADTGNDGIEFANDDYQYQTALLSIFKTSRVVSDPFSVTNPKAIPGAVIEYCISVVNAAGGATATGVNISDVLGSTVGFNTGSILLNGTATTPGLTQTCSGGTAGGSHSGGATGGTVSGTLSDITGGANRTLIFRVTVQ